MNIVILDTGCANLASIEIAIQKIGYIPIITSDPVIVQNSKKIFLPGVGTAAAVMETLSQKKLITVIRNAKQPILGICLGMQLFFDFSSESQGVRTLGILKSKVSLLQSNTLSLPHIGWNKVFFNQMNPLFKNITSGSRFYFVHSYFVTLNKYTIATTDYGISFSAVIQKNNFFGVQFHPEKSGNIGSQLLKNFIEM